MHPVAVSKSHTLPNMNQNMTPAARQLAEMNNINPETVVGTGKNGQITEADILDVLSKKMEEPQAGPGPSEPLSQNKGCLGALFGR